MGADRVSKLYEKRAIEIAPLAFMRGRTLNHAFIILDEAQNTTPEQMKMFLTRIGIGAKAVVTGDITQIDLPKGHKSGLKEAMEVLRDVRGLAFTEFRKEDVVRHPLVARIVEAYEKRQPANVLISLCNTPVTVRDYPCGRISCAGRVPRWLVAARSPSAWSTPMKARR
jgi:phosphate starvation-inducible protein PhoH and related proteins